jgi:2-(1,2-epoxy-1,2-dihydrophenyl)acetyl-CoA isomerase
MQYSNILLDLEDGIATITLNRPDKLNAYTTEMGEEFTHAFRALERDPKVRAIVMPTPTA